MFSSSDEQSDTRRQQQVLHDHQMSFPAEDRRLSNGDGKVHKGNKSYQGHGIKEKSIKSETVTQLFLHVVRYPRGNQSAVESTP